MSALEEFRGAEAAAYGPWLEVGTKRSIADRVTHHRHWIDWSAPLPPQYVMLDIEPGLDVDVVGDAARLPFPPASFGAVVACSLLEHVMRPWVVVPELARVLRPGGVLFIQTHQTFPLHAYPHDYFRFSTDALRLLVEDADLRVMGADYDFPATIVPPDDVPEWNEAAPAWLNVSISAIK